jgi:hypothetical protein
MFEVNIHYFVAGFALPWVFNRIIQRKYLETLIGIKNGWVRC